ncbi:hypothetical protein PENSTE_c049G01402 [Penicillium steckii]|uniref:Uncharacterized protein n=1 Tax=Penicillium steckii TaxID=303698 RepID=A0A1V6SI01_9EURO|nr:hypothetical protein PENSTE_c049G01402 [Penicillium steckii]
MTAKATRQSGPDAVEKCTDEWIVSIRGATDIMYKISQHVQEGI